ncbi:MAG: PorT family protein [Bacteroidaceae bacterium]|nr:PorT family protein [Bacteroidaceae bacterium]
MKRITIIALLAVTVTLSASAQELRYGVTAGADITLPGKQFDSRVGFHIGAKMEMGFPSIAEGLFLDATLSMTQKPMKGSWGISSYGEIDPVYIEAEQTLTPTYLQLALQPAYRFGIGNGFGLFVKGGPYVATGIFGNSKVKWNASDGTHGSDKEGVFKHAMNRFDWGLGVAVGAEFGKHLQFTVGHDWGLKKLDKNGVSNLKHRVLSLSLAYMF